MREALLILRKDVRRLWAPIVLADAGIATIAVSDAMLPRHMAMQTRPMLSAFLPLLAGCYLVVSLMHEEKTVGDTGYWLTRPFPRRSIVLSKLLFALLFLYLPLALGQIVALAVNGIPLAGYWGTPAADALFSTLTACAAAAGMAAVTSGMVQFIWAAMLWIIGYLASVMVLDSYEMLDWPVVEGIRTTATWAVMLMCGAAVVWLMYTRRSRTVATGIVAASVVVVVLVRLLFPWHLAFAIKERLLDSSADALVRVAFNPAGGQQKTGAGALYIPIALSGVPEGMQVAGNRVALSVDYQQTNWRSPWNPRGQLIARDASPGYTGRQRLSNGRASLYVPLDSFPYDRLAYVPAHLHANIAFTLFGPPAVLRMADPSQSRRVPGNGFCAVLGREALVPACIWAFSDPGAVDLRCRDLPDEPRQSFFQPLPSYSNNGPGLWRGGRSSFIYQVPSYPRELYLEVRQPIAYFESSCG
jgi:hypothetical protein